MDNQNTPKLTSHEKSRILQQKRQSNDPNDQHIKRQKRLESEFIQTIKNEPQIITSQHQITSSQSIPAGAQIVQIHVDENGNQTVVPVQIVNEMLEQNVVQQTPYFPPPQRNISESSRKQSPESPVQVPYLQKSPRDSDIIELQEGQILKTFQPSQVIQQPGGGYIIANSELQAHQIIHQNANTVMNGSISTIFTVFKKASLT